jgi:iron complex transport system substrate-binding protein
MPFRASREKEHMKTNARGVLVPSVRALGMALAVLWPALAGAAEPARPRPTAPPPQRIASLNLSADEILVELVPVERLVSVTVFADDPKMSNIVGRVPSSAMRVTRAKLETLVELRPDLVVVSEYSDADFMHMLTESGLRYHRVAGLSSFEGIHRGILDLAAAVGAPERGRELAARFQASVQALDGLLKGVKPRRVLPWSDPYTYGASTLLGEIVTHAGGTNVGAELGVDGVRPIGVERALAADPDVFLVAAGGEGARLAAHPVLSKTKAVREGRIVEIPGPLVSTLSHHSARAARFFAHALHPDVVPAPE